MAVEPKRKGLTGVPRGYVGVAEVCEMFGRSRKSIARMIVDGRLPQPLRHGRQLIWDKLDLQRRLTNAKFCK